MKKTFSLPTDIVKSLERVAKDFESTQSTIVTRALMLFLIMYHGDPQKAKDISAMIPEGQTNIFEILDRNRSK